MGFGRAGASGGMEGSMTEYPTPPDFTPERRVITAQMVAGQRLYLGMQRSPVTKWLVAAIALAYLLVGWLMFKLEAATALGIVLAPRPAVILSMCGAQDAQYLAQGQLWRLVTTVFLHGGSMHIVLNGVALLALGRMCEAVYGPIRFLWLFLAAGVCGATLSWVGGNAVSVGASGGIFGLMGAAIVFGWRYKNQLPKEAGDFFRRSLLPWVGLNLVIGVIVPFIDNLGHIGGLVGGVVTAMGMGNRVLERGDQVYL